MFPLLSCRLRPVFTTRRRRFVLVALALASLFALRVHFWGRPVPLVWQPAGPGHWRNGQGVTLSAAPGHGSFYRGTERAFDRPTAATPGARLLIICLDGVPFSEMRALWDEGRFREFFPPVGLVSTFPSESEVALTAILQAPPAPGYENLYFDRRRGRIAGGISVTLAQSAPYLKKLDYDEPAIFKGIHFILPRKSFRADLGRLRKRFLESSQPVFVAHISSTDGLYHLARRGEVRPLLLEVEGVVRDLYFEGRGQLRALLFSDHGNNQTPSHPAPLKESLEKAGFRVSDRLAGPRTVVIPQFGLVSFAAVFTSRDAVAEAARVLSMTEGVDAVAYAESNRVIVASRTGQAVIEATPDGLRFRYHAARPVLDDALGLLPTWEDLRRAKKLDAAGFAAETDLFEATFGTPFPDALYRLYRSSLLEGLHVENRADLLVSLADGYYNGSGVFERIVDFNSTHGGLGRGSSVGFAMTTDAPFPRALRYDELFKPPFFSLPR